MQANHPSDPDSAHHLQTKLATPLPSSINEPDKHYRYPGPDSFEDDEVGRGIFFGRKDKVAEVLNRLLSNKLLVMFSKPGLGKTSLLQAGLFPQLRTSGFLPISLRFNHRETSLLEELQLAVSKACKDPAIVFTAGEGDTYWEYFNTALFSKGDRFLTPILILDQFEEIFTLQSEEYRLDLGKQLGDLVSGQIPGSVRERLRAGEKPSYPATPPNVRLLISLREDSVGALQELVPFIPGILSQRFQLTPLDRAQARTAIVAPAQISDRDIVFISLPFTYQSKTDSQPDTVEAILDYLQDKRGSIEPFQLQLLCRYIELKVVQNQDDSTDPIVVDLQSYLGGQEGVSTVIKRFYQIAINTLSGWRVWRKGGDLFETDPLNPEVERENLSGSQIKRSFGLKQKTLSQLVEQKVLHREERLDSHAFELSHNSPVLAVFKVLHSQVKFQWLALAVLLILLFSGFEFWQWQQAEDARKQAVDIMKQVDEASKQVRLLGKISDANLDEYIIQVKTLVALHKPYAKTIKEPEMLTIPAGRFMRGSMIGQNDETPVYQVAIPVFSIGIYEVTFEQYDQFAASTPDYKLSDDEGWGRGKRPVINVSWNQATEYAAWLSEKTGKRYRLVTEAEWEYAVRAGTKSDYYWGDDKEDPDNYVWYYKNADNKTHLVGDKKPNAFALYDMSGNVREWVQDCYQSDYNHSPTDGSAWDPQKCSGFRVLRGGSWDDRQAYFRSASRSGFTPDNSFYNIGFRLAQD